MVEPPALSRESAGRNGAFNLLAKLTWNLASATVTWVGRMTIMVTHLLECAMTFNLEVGEWLVCCVHQSGAEFPSYLAQGGVQEGE